MIALHDPHHSQLSQALVYLFEKRLGIKLYRPAGHDWYHNGYYWHPIEEEALGNLSRGADIETDLAAQAPSDYSWQKSDAGLSYFDQDNLKFRWLPLDRANEIQWLICTTDRNEARFSKLRRERCPKAKIIRYIGNRDEITSLDNWDVGLFATLKYYNAFKRLKPCILYHPEFDTNVYRYEPPPKSYENPAYSRILRNFLNFTYHHREPGSPWETWCRYWGYCNDLGYTALLHGLGTPPHGVDVEMDVIIDTCFERMGRPELKDRSKWPDLRWNQGEPSSQKQIAQLMRLSNMAVHIKRGSEGYGFVIHGLAACGRPMIVEEDAYRELSAYDFMFHRKTCLFVTGNHETDKANLKWAMEPEVNHDMSWALHSEFSKRVQFDREAQDVRKLL